MSPLHKSILKIWTPTLNIGGTNNVYFSPKNILQPRERGVMRFHMLHNIDTALHFLHCKKIKLVNIRSEDIVDGNPKLTLGLIWTIILHFQVSPTVIKRQLTHLTRLFLISKLRVPRRGAPRAPLQNSVWKVFFLFLYVNAATIGKAAGECSEMRERLRRRQNYFVFYAGSWVLVCAC